MTHQLGSIWSILLFVYLIFMLHVDIFFYFNTIFSIRLYMYQCVHMCVCVYVLSCHHIVSPQIQSIRPQTYTFQIGTHITDCEAVCLSGNYEKHYHKNSEAECLFTPKRLGYFLKRDNSVRIHVLLGNNSIVAYSNWIGLLSMPPPTYS